MEFERFKTEGIAHNAYVIGTMGIGIVVDPRRDVDEYVNFAVEKGLSIQYVLQTHRQEDFVLGSATLRALFGAKIVAGAHDLSRFADKQLKDGETMEIGELIIKALHTPGHTPESVCYALTQKKRPDKVWAVLTGDALFAGETGRTDLPDPNKTAENAGLLYDGIHSKLLPLGDNVLVYPAHGSGSVCGGKMADFDATTIGFERTYNKVFTLSRDEFIQHKMHERIPRPPYFKRMEKVNLEGGIKMPNGWNCVPMLLPEKFAKESASGVVIDTRHVEAFAGGHIPRSYSIWLQGLPVFGGWIVPNDKQDVFLVVESESKVQTALLHLARIGIDNVKGVLAGGFGTWRDAGLPIETMATLDVSQLQKLGKVPVLDVREITEFEDEGHLQHAKNAYVGHLQDHMSDVASKFQKQDPLVVTCSVGHRGSLASSILCRNGFTKVHNLLGGMGAWEKQKLTTKKGLAGNRPLDQKSIEKDFPHEGQ
jgi:hydroxyacylglutathione hydrolase